MQPVMTTRAWGLRRSESSKTTWIDSALADSMNAQVLTMTRSALSGSSAGTRPMRSTWPSSFALSTRFFGHPSVSIQYVGTCPPKGRANAVEPRHLERRGLLILGGARRCHPEDSRESDPVGDRQAPAAGDLGA